MERVGLRVGGSIGSRFGDGCVGSGVCRGGLAILALWQTPQGLVHVNMAGHFWIKEEKRGVGELKKEKGTRVL